MVNDAASLDQTTYPVLMRVYYRTLGGHVHCRVFSGPTPKGPWVFSGDLAFRVEEWVACYTSLSRIAELVEDTRV